MPPMDRKPPLAVSPRRLRPRRNLRSSVPSVQTPPASIRTKPKTPLRSFLPCEQLLRPEFDLISTELMEMAKRMKEEFAEPQASPGYKTTTPMFERGRFYEVYSARRNERLKRKQVEFEADDSVVQDPCVAVELAKRRNSKKATESMRKSVPANFTVSRASTLRSSVRGSKEMKKSAAAAGSVEKKAPAEVGRRIGTRSVLRL